MNRSLAENSDLPDKTRQNLTANQLAAIARLVAGDSLEIAAQQCSVSPRTIQRWMEMPAFRSVLDTRKQDLFLEALNRLKLLALKAVSRLDGLLDSANERVVLAAAKTTIENLLQANGALDTEARVRALEEIAGRGAPI